MSTSGSRSRPVAVEVHTDWDPSSVGGLPILTSSHPFAAVRRGMQGYVGRVDGDFSHVIIKNARINGKSLTSLIPNLPHADHLRLGVFGLPHQR